MDDQLSQVIDNIQELCQERNVSVNKALTESGAGKDLIANMRKGQNPSFTKFVALARYFDVSIEHVTGIPGKGSVSRDNSLSSKLARHLYQLRMEKGWSMEQAAGYLELSTRYYSNLENGQSMCSLNTAVRVAMRYNISLDDLVGLTVNKEEKK